MLLAPLFFALSSGKGLYTLLLGSGVSSGAGIPTGHQVMLDLIERLAGVSKQTADPSPEAWYERQFGAPPTYSALLDKMTQTPAERANLLHAYFEPTPEERAAGRKVPTAAHHAVATLAKRGYIRLVLTTNFDSLLEQAMRQAGLDPVIVSRPDDVAGLRPLSHVDLCIVKLHGDYHDLRTLNTQSELANYDPAVTQLLTRVLTDYGLIVSGWSGEHDTALLRLVAEVKSPHYGTYWAHRGSLTAEAQRAIVARGAMPLHVSDADSFLHEMAEGLEALEESSRQTLQGEDVMFARLKRYMQAEDRWIDLDELVQSEAERVASRLTSERFRFDRDAFGRETFVARATDYETIVKTLARCLLMGAYWGRSAHDKMWLSALQRTVPETEYAAGNMGWIDLADYPALQLFYALGLGAVAAGRAGLAIQVLKGGRVRYAHTDRPWVSRLHQWFVQDTNWFRWLPGLEGRPAPVSERLWQLGAMLRADIKVEPGRYDEVFDDWELLLSLTCADERERTFGDPRAPVGRFSWNHHELGDRSVLHRFRRALESMGRDWDYVKAGLCGGDVERVKALLGSIEAQPELQRFHGL